MMRCFRSCFGASLRRRKSLKPPNPSHPEEASAFDYAASATLYPKEPKEKKEEEEEEEEPLNPFSESELNNISPEKKVTLDLNLKTFEDSCGDNLVKTNEEGKQDCLPKGSDSSVVGTKMGTYPPEHRYQNCADVDEQEIDFEDQDDGENDGKEEDGGQKGGGNQSWVQEESSESLFSLSIESRKQVSSAERAEIEVNSPVRTSESPHEEHKAKVVGKNARPVCSVLNPIENLTQWKAVKTKVNHQPAKHPSKENINLDQDLDLPPSPEPSFELSKTKLEVRKHAEQDIGVDTSLSSWLIECDTPPASKKSSSSVGNSPSKRTISPSSHEDRPILGALTVEELWKFTGNTPPRKSRNRSPDEMPIIGTVGSYWSHTGQTVDSDSSSSCSRLPKTGSKNREVERVKWDSSPIKARLELAFDKSVTEA